MKLKLLIFLLMSTSIFTIRLPFSGKYPLTAEIVALNYNTNTVEILTATGISYYFEGIEDYAVGDLVSVIMDSNHTPDYVPDDVVIKVQYSGYNIKETI